MADFVVYPHAVLTAKAVPRPVDAELLVLGETLRDAASSVQAYGLAAAHLGHAEPVVVVSLSVDTGQRDYRLLYNPEIMLTADERASGMVGSVSLPGIEVPVERPIWAEIAFDTADGERQTMRVEGFVARVAQHEIDQMDGVFFLGRISRIKRETALRKFEKSLRR